jgi:hypothetical protein
MNLDRRLLIYVAVTSLVLTFVALMLLPIGLPHFEHVVSYWWADPYFKFAVGQDHKILWYRKTAFSALFTLWIFGSAWVWWKLLPRSRSWLLVFWAYIVFCATAILSQTLVLGDWTTFKEQNLADMWDACPAFVKVVAQIDSPTGFMQDMVKYAGVEGRLRGTLATKAPPFILMFYYVDQVGQALMEWTGFDTKDLGLRAIVLSSGFTALIGLFLIPMFFLFRSLFSVQVARVAVLVMSMSPLAAHGFSHLAAQGHHILIPISALALLLVTIGLTRKKLLLNLAGLAVSASVGMVVWESIAFTVLLLFINALYLYRTGAFKKVPRNIWLGGLGSVCALLLITWLVFKVAFGLDVAAHFWHHFVELHVGVQLKRMFITNGPITYFGTLLTNPLVFLFYLGVPLIVQMYYSVKAQWSWPLPLNRIDSVIVFGTFFFVLLLDLSGISSETSRLWAFLAPPFYLAAMMEFAKIRDRGTLTAIGIALYILLGLQILIVRNVQYSI